MSSSFPLYDSLYKEISKEEEHSNLTTAQKNKVIKTINNLDKEGHELIYILIRTYQIENNEENISFKLPYNGTYVDNDVYFELDALPILLKKMLFKFSEMHLNKMKEEKNKFKNKNSE